MNKEENLKDALYNALNYINLSLDPAERYDPEKKDEFLKSVVGYTQEELDEMLS
jgi:hypothetical protein